MTFHSKDGLEITAYEEVVLTFTLLRCISHIVTAL